jgi:hypothetical protein
MRFQLLTLAPHDIHSIPGNSVVLPFGTPVDNSHGGVLKGVPTRPCILVIGLPGHSLGAFPQPRCLSPLGLHCRHLRDGTQDSSDREGQPFASMIVGMLLKRSCHHPLLLCKAKNRKQLLIAYGRYNGPIQVMQKQSGAVPILLLALSALATSAYTSFGVFQGLKPNISYSKLQSTTQPHQLRKEWYYAFKPKHYHCYNPRMLHIWYFGTYF